MAGTVRDPNLFLRLLKWAQRQDENFLTESLAVMLELLLNSDRTPTRAAGARIVTALTDGFISVDAESTEMLEIRTQVTTTEGRPDLELRLPDRLAVCEVKFESGLRLGQLEGYRKYLLTSGFPQTRLNLLTKYPPLLPKDSEQPDRVVRWYELADAIERELTELKQADPPCHFLCEQFQPFLKERNMALAQVGWHLSEGTRALHSFLVMLQEAAKGCQVTTKRFLHSIKDIPKHVGFKLDGGKYFLGLDLEDPGKLWFSTRTEINPDAARELNDGEVRTDSWAPGQPRWYRGGDLDSEEVHFYSRSKVEQIRWLEKFLRECLEMARRIEKPVQPPLPPDQPEE